MNPQEPNESPEAAHRFQLILWAALVASLGMYFVITMIVPPSQTEPNPGLVTGLLAAAVGMVALSFLVKSRLSGNARAAFIVALAMCEAAALFGVVVWFVTGSTQAYYFLLLGFVGLLLHFPRRPA